MRILTRLSTRMHRIKTYMRTTPSTQANRLQFIRTARTTRQELSRCTPILNIRQHFSLSKTSRHCSASFTTTAAASAYDPNFEQLSTDRSGTDVCSRKLSIFDVPGNVSEEICDIFLANGATSATVEEYRPPGSPEEQIYADGGAQKVWERCTVIVHFPIEESEDSIEDYVKDLITDSLGLPCQHKIDDIVTEDWVAAIQDSYQPVKIAPKLWIIPVDRDAVNIMLQPGIAFGTGDHPTTRLCLQWLHDNRRSLKGKAVLDYGTGSGILAIGALLFGAEQAVGTDIDELSIRAATQNATLNAIPPNSFSCFRVPPEYTPEVVQQLEGQGPFDVTIANILLGPVISLAPLLGGATKPGGVLVLSGILESQCVPVIEAYAKYFEGFEVQTINNQWAMITGTRKK